MANEGSVKSGIGVDIILLSRIRALMDTAGKSFLDRVFTSSEQQQAESHSNPVAYLAMTFAAKEAIFKAFQLSWNMGVQLTEIEITNGRYGEPIAILTGRFAEIAADHGVSNVPVSLSYDGDYAIGMAMLE